MKTSRISAVIAAVLIAVTSMAGCNSNKKDNDTYSRPINVYSENSEIGKDKIEASINADASHNDSTFKLNRVIDSGKTLDSGEKYIYLDVTIKNAMDEAYEVNGLNNFYLILEDGTEIFTDIRVDLYAKQAINGYEQLLEIPANGEFNGYVGFLLDPNVTSFTACYFATANKNDKGTVIQCPVTSADIISAPEGFLK